MPKKTRSELESSVNAGNECLDMVKDKLSELGIQMDACPPMFFPEAINNLFVWTAQASRECSAVHGWHDMNETLVTQCIRDWILRKQGRPEAPKR